MPEKRLSSRDVPGRPQNVRRSCMAPAVHPKPPPGVLVHDAGLVETVVPPPMHRPGNEAVLVEVVGLHSGASARADDEPFAADRFPAQLQFERAEVPPEVLVDDRDGANLPALADNDERATLEVEVADPDARELGAAKRVELHEGAPETVAEVLLRRENPCDHVAREWFAFHAAFLRCAERQGGVAVHPAVRVDRPLEEVA